LDWIESERLMRQANPPGPHAGDALGMDIALTLLINKKVLDLRPDRSFSYFTAPDAGEGISHIWMSGVWTVEGAMLHLEAVREQSSTAGQLEWDRRPWSRSFRVVSRDRLHLSLAEYPAGTVVLTRKSEVK
jgi:hypothetical protein